MVVVSCCFLFFIHMLGTFVYWWCVPRGLFQVSWWLPACYHSCQPPRSSCLSDSRSLIGSALLDHWFSSSTSSSTFISSSTLISTTSRLWRLLSASLSRPWPCFSSWSSSWILLAVTVPLPDAMFEFNDGNLFLSHLPSWSSSWSPCWSCLCSTTIHQWVVWSCPRITSTYFSLTSWFPRWLISHFYFCIHAYVFLKKLFDTTPLDFSFWPWRLAEVFCTPTLIVHTFWIEFVGLHCLAVNPIFLTPEVLRPGCRMILLSVMFHKLWRPGCRMILLSMMSRDLLSANLIKWPECFGHNLGRPGCRMILFHHFFLTVHFNRWIDLCFIWRGVCECHCIHTL